MRVVRGGAGTHAGPLAPRVKRLTGTVERWCIPILILLILHAVAIVLLASSLGPGMSSDSVFYASAARSFAETGELVTHLGSPLSAWPPGFPVVLGGALRVGLDLELFSVALNAVCVALVVLLTYSLGHVTLSSPLLALLSAGLVSVSASTVRVFSMLWTEPVFSAITLATLVLLVRAVREQRFGLREVSMAAVAVSAATLVRFAGVTLIPVVAIGAMLAVRRSGWVRATALGVASGLTASAGMVFVMYRNIVFGGTLLGTRAPNPHSVRSIVFATLDAMSQYVLPVKTPLAGEIGAVAAILLLLSVWLAFRAGLYPMWIVAGFVAIYWPFLWYSANRAGIDVPNERLTAPILGPMVVLTFYVLRDLYVRIAANYDSRRTAKSVVLNSIRLLVVLFVALSATTSLRVGWGYAISMSRTGMGHNSVASLSSPLGASLASLPPEARIAANDANHAYWASGRRPIIQSPRIGYVYESLGYESLDTFKARIRDGSVTHLAFFDANIRGVSEPQELVAIGVPIELVAVYPDGSLWRTRPA